MRTAWSNSFLALEPATEKLHFPSFTHVHGTRTWPAPAERTELYEAIDETGLQKSVMYRKASPWSDLSQKTKLVREMLSLEGIEYVFTS